MRFFRKRPFAMYKDNAVGTVVAETGRDCGTTACARLSDLSMPFQLCGSPSKGEVRRSRECEQSVGSAAWRKAAKLYDVLIP